MDATFTGTQALTKLAFKSIYKTLLEYITNLDCEVLDEFGKLHTMLAKVGDPANNEWLNLKAASRDLLTDALVWTDITSQDQLLELTKKRYLSLKTTLALEFKKTNQNEQFPRTINYMTVSGFAHLRAYWESYVYQGLSQDIIWKFLYSELLKYNSTIKLYYRAGDNDLTQLSWIEATQNQTINIKAKNIQFRVIITDDTFDVNALGRLFAVGIYYGINGIIGQMLSRPTAFVYDDKYILSIADSSISLVNNTLFIVNTDQQWVRHTKHNINDFCWYFSQLIAVSCINDEIFNMFVGSYNNEQAIESYIETEAMFFEYPDNEKRLRFLWINALTPTTRELEIGYAVDGK